jgi:hypothetical protein
MVCSGDFRGSSIRSCDHHIVVRKPGVSGVLLEAVRERIQPDNLVAVELQLKP